MNLVLGEKGPQAEPRCEAGGAAVQTARVPQRQRGGEHERGAVRNQSPGDVQRGGEHERERSSTRALGMCTPIVSTVSTTLNETELLGRFAQTDSLM